MRYHSAISQIWDGGATYFNFPLFSEIVNYMVSPIQCNTIRGEFTCDYKASGPEDKEWFLEIKVISKKKEVFNVYEDY